MQSQLIIYFRLTQLQFVYSWDINYPKRKIILLGCIYIVFLYVFLID
jgi:hypothetical protein